MSPGAKVGIVSFPQLMAELPSPPSQPAAEQLSPHFQLAAEYSPLSEAGLPPTQSTQTNYPPPTKVIMHRQTQHFAAASTAYCQF